MRILHSILPAFIAVILLSACAANDDRSNTEGKLDGAWEIKRAEGTMAEMNIGTVYSFEGEKLTFEQGSFRNPGKTVVTDSTFSFQAEGNELLFMYDYHFSGDTLVVSMQKSGQTFYMVKK